MTTAIKDTKYVLEVANLKKHYLMGDTYVHALRGISFALEPGEYVAIMGQSGSGKSTLLNILGCLDLPSAGHYYVEGTNVAHLDDRELSRLRRERFGFVFQSFNLVSQLSVLENIEIPLFYQGWHQRASRKRAQELAERVGLQHRLRHRPTELSGGQRQRVAIARALANDPAVILADEPTGNLDSSTGEEIMSILDELAAQNRTIILVTHENEIAAHANRCIKLADGNIATDEQK